MHATYFVLLNWEEYFDDNTIKHIKHVKFFKLLIMKWYFFHRNAKAYILTTSNYKNVYNFNSSHDGISLSLLSKVISN